MGFFEIVFLIVVVFVLIYFVVHSYLLIKYERKKLDYLRRINNELVTNNLDNDSTFELLYRIVSELDTLDLTDFTD